MTQFEHAIRLRLLGRRERLVESIASLAIRLRAAWATNTEAAPDLREQEQTVKELQRVDRALLRLVQRAYGLCESCGRALGTQQLLAEPDAALCSQCGRDSATQMVSSQPPSAA